MVKKCVFITCNDAYVPYAIIALILFTHHNPGYDKCIIGDKFNDKMKTLCKSHNVIVKNTPNLFPYWDSVMGKWYGKRICVPDCFFHFYACKLFFGIYDYCVLIEPDVYAIKRFDIPFDKIEYIGACAFVNGVTMNKQGFLGTLNNVKKIIQSSWTVDYNSKRIISGILVYNIKKLNTIGFYETACDYATQCVKKDIALPGDDDLINLYYLLHPKHFFFFPDGVGLATYQAACCNDKLALYHDYPNKIWTNPNFKNPYSQSYCNAIIKIIPKEYLETYVPILLKAVQQHNK